MSEIESESPQWKKAFPFNLSDEEWLRTTEEEMMSHGYGRDAIEKVLDAHRRSIEHNKKDKSTLTPRMTQYGD